MIKIAHVVHGNALGAHELPIPTSLAPKNSSSGTIRVDDQNVVDIEIGDNNMPRHH